MVTYGDCNPGANPDVNNKSSVYPCAIKLFASKLSSIILDVD